MTIEQSDKVDGMGIDARLNEFVLLISDHLRWENEAVHIEALESKIGGYLNYINSGQHLEAVPRAKGLPIRIKFVHEHKPTPTAQSMLRSVKGQLEDINIRFSYESLPEGY